MSFIPLSKTDIDNLEKEKREIQRRRKSEQERKKYFFNEKQRNWGIDKDFIAKQIQSKKEKKENDILIDREYRNKVDSFVDKLSNLDSNRIKFYKKRSYDVGKFQKNTKIEDCDTFDLNDPNILKKTMPPRINDESNIPSCSIQKFDGEDLKINQRIKKQQKEVENWCKQIINEKKENIKNEQEIIKKYVEERNKYLNHLENVEKSKFEQKKINSIICAKANIKEASIPKQKMEKEKEESLSEKEIKQMLESKFLNETWDSTLRNDNKNRFIPYNFKGFSQNQKQKILNKQMSQIDEKIENKNLLKQQENDYYKQQQQYQRKALLQLRNSERLKQQRNKDIAQSQEIQIDQSKQKIQEINKIYANKITPDFFQQFQTSTR